jgi:hypothetical protein
MNEEQEQPKGLKFTVRDGGAKAPEAIQPQEEKPKEDLDHAVTHTKSGNRRKS